MAYSGASSASASTRGCSEACGQARHRSRGGAGPPGGHGVGGLARQWPRGLTPAAAACEGGGRGKALAAALRARAAQCERWRAPRRLHAREVEARGSSGHREGAARRGRAARVGAVR